MSKMIEIYNLKNIKELKFQLPGPGVHLLAGANGAGKTSLLACLRRLGQSNAFARHFITSIKSRSLDNFTGAEIVYRLNEESVTYVYGGERWVPRPRSASDLIRRFGYPDVLYIGATADRLTPRPEDFRLHRIRPAHNFIRDGANRIFETNKFDSLKVINLQRGVGNSAFVLQTIVDGRIRYYSEKNFSLGELCVLKFLRELHDCAHQALVLIDELELALHPRAQAELFNWLQEIARTKNLTIIVSTHSVSLLKRANRNSIYFLEAEGGIVSTIKGCFPTYALGNIAYDEERAPDVVIYVEDESAQYLTEALLRLSISARFTLQALFPTIHVLPVGPFMSVVRFLGKSDAMLPRNTASVALLDGDVRDETLQQWTSSGNHAMLAEFQRFERQIFYLPWTPEVGVIEYLQANRIAAEQRIRQELNQNQLRLRMTDLQFGTIAGDPGYRDSCKRALKAIVAHLCESLPNAGAEDVRKAIFTLFAKWYFENQSATVLQLMGPIISAHR
jgi:ABC-type lipoprotein export system ATPase subunit